MPRIFFTGENVFGWEGRREYRDYLLEDVDLSLGFEDFTTPNYLRSPLWLMSTFPYDATEADIYQICRDINAARSTGAFGCNLTGRHDTHGIRAEIADALGTEAPIDYTGAWRNNTRKLWDEFSDDKIAMMREYRVSIVPENTNRIGYVTEKLFDALRSGSVPVYWGSDNDPEPGVLNKDAVLFWERGGDNSHLLQQVKLFTRDRSAWEDFMTREKLKPYAAEYVAERFFLLRQHIERILTRP